MPLKLYADFVSQPCRAIAILLKVLGVDFELVPVALAKGEHTADWFVRLNPMRSLPTIDDDGFILTETAAIMRYIATKFAPESAWNPSDLLTKARVDEYLAWQHGGLRKANCNVFLPVVVHPRVSGKPIDAELVKTNSEALEKALDQMETYFLQRHSYLASNTISIVDINAACELMQVVVIGYPYEQGRPRVADWLKRVRSHCNPSFEEIHKTIKEKGSNVTFKF